MNYPDQRTYQKLFSNKDLLWAAANRNSQFQSIIQSINHLLLTKSILTMNRKTTFLRWLGSFMVGAILLSGAGLNAYAQQASRKAPVDPSTLVEVPAAKQMPELLILPIVQHKTLTSRFRLIFGKMRQAGICGVMTKVRIIMHQIRHLQTQMKL